MQFCPTKLVHEAVSANPFALANCQIALFIYELNYEPGKIHVGYRLPIGSPSSGANEINQKIVSLLHTIATESTNEQAGASSHLGLLTPYLVRIRDHFG